MDQLIRRCTLKDVALLAGVSVTSASMALSDSPRVAAATKEAVRLAATKLGYVPHSAGRALRSRRVSAIAVVLPHSSRHVFSHPTLTALLDGVVSVAADNDLSTILSTSRTEEDEASAYRRFMNGREADGVIVASAAVADANIIGLARSGYPIVIVGRAPHVARATAVSLDDYHGGEVATRHLLEAHDVRRIAHISGPLAHQSALDKLSGYRNALMASAIAPEPSLEIEGDYSDESGGRAVEELVRRRIPFHAIFAANDQMALGAREALQAMGRSVPGDVLLVGYDDIPLARYVEPALTSVQGDMAEVGSAAALRLLELIGGRAPTEPVTLLPTDLVVRKSCGCGQTSALAASTTPGQGLSGEKQQTRSHSK